MLGRLLDKIPDLQMIGTSYNDDMAGSMGQDARDLVESWQYQKLFPKVRLRTDSTAATEWQTTSGGLYIGAGIGGGITGKGAHLLMIDDPYKDAKDAWSQAVRKSIWNWYTTAAYTRLMPGGAIIILLTSWHEDGLDNQVLRAAKETGEKWEVIDIPALWEPNYQGAHPEDPRKKLDESFWEPVPGSLNGNGLAGWPAERLKKTRKLLTPYSWSALYQQRASPESGNIVQRDWIRYWMKKPDKFDRIILSCDLAFKKKEGASRVAFHVWGQLGSKAYLLERRAETMDFVETLETFLAICRKWPTLKEKLVEEKANGSALESVLKSQVPGLIMVTPTDDKAARLRAVAHHFKAGDVLLPHPDIEPWSADVSEELVKFPNSPYNDDTDTTSQALSHLFGTMAGVNLEGLKRAWVM